MPAAIPKSRNNKGKARAEPYDTSKDTASLPLGKQLAHTDKKVRDQAIRNLTAFVSSGDPESSTTRYLSLSDAEMSKLWKGLFYCFWMSDKPLVQQRLAADLAELLLLIKPAEEEARLEAALGFLAGFWEAMCREWAGLDRLRQDKFYMLMRRYVNATFRLLAREEWSEESVDAVNRILTDNGGPLTWEDRRIPMSLSTHLADIYLEELDKVLALPEVASELKCPLVSLLQPFATLLCRTPTPTVHSKLLDSVYKPIISDLTISLAPSKPDTTYPSIVSGCCINEEGDEEVASPGQLRNALLKSLFVTAAEGESVESNRRRVYTYWREEGGDDEDDEDDE